MAIAELIEQGLSKEEALQVAVDQLGMMPADAAFVLAVELGEIDGDVVALNEAIEKRPTRAGS